MPRYSEAASSSRKRPSARTVFILNLPYKVAIIHFKQSTPFMSAAGVFL